MGNIHCLDGASRQGLTEAALVAAFTSALFIVVYGGCSWLTSLRGDVGSVVFAWERTIPFVPLMIIPYMSIDLFFVMAPLVCRRSDERRMFAMRVSFAILIAGLFFLCFPLRFAFERPAPDGWLGAIFSFLHAFDRPYNMFPSLHIALQGILAEVYAAATTGLLRLALLAWFGLVGFSTVLTWQHHVVDVIGGFVLAVFCCYLFSRGPNEQGTANYRVAHLYGIGAVLFGLTAAATGHLFPAWPAAAMLLVCSAYFGLFPNVYRKQGGRLALCSRILLAPVILGHFVSLLYYSRRSYPWNEILPGLWMGRRLSDAKARQAIGLGVTAVLDLTSEFSEVPSFRAARYLNVPILDLTAPTSAQFAEAVSFIKGEMERGTVYVHCKVGYSRSAAIIGGYLIEKGDCADARDAVALLRGKRPGLVVRDEVVSFLQTCTALD